MVIRRESGSGKVLVLVGEDEVLKDAKDFEHGSIRFWPADFEELKTMDRLTHFNLEVSRHKKGDVYHAVRIVRPGFFDGRRELLPLLDYSDNLLFECIECKEHLDYADLIEEDFEHSFSSIKNVDELKEAIVNRYSQSLPHLTEEEILAAGVSMTLLRRHS